ncbi:GNAT family N-acetyltransferase [Kitasatospora sp. NPDC051853]|uniref:GNAT family N-acetyltransferase n=1 Tax=Kitasatospora sp. NPDC051853 TaxID=3364058 RepID=UPI0037AF723E
MTAQDDATAGLGPTKAGRTARDWEIRRFTAADTSAVTALLHRAYAELAAAGLNFTAAHQDEGTTLRRASAGASWVLLHHGVIAATSTISLPPEDGLRALTAQAREPGRAWLNQLAVDPGHRGPGLARLLRDTGFDWARRAGAHSVGLDTARPAGHLVRLYTGWGFADTDEIRWPGKTYRSNDLNDHDLLRNAQHAVRVGTHPSLDAVAHVTVPTDPAAVAAEITRLAGATAAL